MPTLTFSNISVNRRAAEEWVRNNVLPYLPKTKIRYLLVDNEVLRSYSEQGRQMWRDLVPAMQMIKRSLKALNISTFPPSRGMFRYEIRDNVIIPMLNFLNRTKSFLFIDVYPYFPWSQNPYNISLDFALFRGGLSIRDPGSALVYTNLLDPMLDSLVFAKSKLGFSNILLAISETGLTL
ncbi:hypothetical protein HN51_005974 [Arachis hypogaea]|nr:probable glucan endo-1,3-beta-glucosidase A6 [Arachis duranensis]XP_029153468.1 probable glucan endo-1,3-beta-glucosidase A6 [Arachis hypogaea]